MEEPEEIILDQFTAVIIGPGGVGKTTLIKKLNDPDKVITTKYDATAGFSHELLKLWDIKVIAIDVGGQVIFRQLYGEQFLPEAIVVIFVFDASDRSNDGIEDTRFALTETLSLVNEYCIFFIIANKIDKENIISRKEISDLLSIDFVQISTQARKFGGYFEVSALHGNNILKLKERLKEEFDDIIKMEQPI